IQKDTSLPPPSALLASNPGQGVDRQASPSGAPGQRETGRRASPNVHRKPNMSKVILGVVADKGAHGRVSLATLKKAIATTGYNMTRSGWRLKRVLKGLVDKGMLKQVTGKGALGSFRIGNKHASKVKFRSQSRGRSGQRQSGRRRPGQRRPGLRRPAQRQSGQCRPGQRRPGQRRLLAGSQKGYKQLN
ncbi:HILS1 protein, partial [Crocuta crocuta]